MACTRKRERIVIDKASALRVADGEQSLDGVEVVVEDSGVVVCHQAAHGDEKSHAAHVEHGGVLERIVRDGAERRIGDGMHLLLRLSEVVVVALFAELVVSVDAIDERLGVLAFKAKLRREIFEGVGFGGEMLAVLAADEGQRHLQSGVILLCVRIDDLEDST